MFCFNDVDFPTGSINDQVIAHSNGYQPRKQARVGNAYFVRLEPFDGAGRQTSLLWSNARHSLRSRVSQSACYDCSKQSVEIEKNFCSNKRALLVPAFLAMLEWNMNDMIYDTLQHSRMCLATDA